MSILRYKQKLLADGGVARGGDGGGGGGGQAPTVQNVSNTSIPTYAQPYVETLLGQAQAVTNINNNPYQPYGAQRIADFTPMQAQAFQNIANQQVAGQVGEASNIASAVGQQGLQTPSQAQQLQNQALGYGAQGAEFGGMGAAQAGMTAGQSQRQASMYGAQGAGFGGAAAGLAPQAQQYGANAAGIGMGGLGYGAQGAQAGQQAAGIGMMGVGAGQQAAGYGAQGANIGQNVADMSTNAAAQQAYMSPYIQNALQPQLQEMQRQYGITGQQEKGQATAAGAFGGSREAIMRSENERNKNMAMNLAIGQGYQNAFNAAQNQMNQAAQLGMQGTQQGIAGQQAAMQGIGQGISGQQAAMQGAGVGLSGISSAMQGQQAGLAGLGQAGTLYGQGITGAQAGLQGVGQQISAGQLGLQGTAQGMQGAQTGLQGVGQATQAGQYGLQGLNTAGTAASTLGALGQTQYGQESGINQAMYTAGLQQQGQQQAALSNQYQDYLTQLNYPYQQLGFMSNILRGVPLSQASNAVYQAAPSAVSQLAGLGTAGAGLYGMSTKKKGGSIKEKKGSGLADIQLHRLVG